MICSNKLIDFKKNKKKHLNLKVPTYHRSSTGQPQQTNFDRRQYILKAIPVAQNDNTRYQTGYSQTN